MWPLGVSSAAKPKIFGGLNPLFCARCACFLWLGVGVGCWAGAGSRGCGFGCGFGLGVGLGFWGLGGAGGRWLVLGLGAGPWAAVSVLGFWFFFRSLGALLFGFVFGARFWRGLAAGFCAVAGLCFLRFAFGKILLQGSVFNGPARGYGALLQGSVFYVLRSDKFCCRALFRAVSLLRRAAAAACFFGSVFGRAGALVFCSIFSCRAWRARGAGRRRAGSAGGRWRGWCATVALRRFSVACAGARAVPWRGAARGAVALRFLRGVVRARLCWRRAFLRRCASKKNFFLKAAMRFFSFRFFFLACARVRFFFDVRFSLRRSVRCCFA